MTESPKCGNDAYRTARHIVKTRPVTKYKGRILEIHRVSVNVKE